MKNIWLISGNIIIDSPHEKYLANIVEYIDNPHEQYLANIGKYIDSPHEKYLVNIGEGILHQISLSRFLTISECLLPYV